ncbi:hypothetical protein AAON49_12240 [Pseudotenacibaculum sp. MALMAid0570]
MTNQEFNHIFNKYTKNKNGIKLKDKIVLTGYELKDFVGFAIDTLKKKVENKLIFLTELVFFFFMYIFQYVKTKK